jgi:hypothetical protein
MTETQAAMIEKWIGMLDRDIRDQTHRTFAPYEKMELLGLLRALRPNMPKARVSGVPYEVDWPARKEMAE